MATNKRMRVPGAEEAVSSLERISVQTLKGVGNAMAKKLAILGIHNLQDVLFHLPFRYQDRTRLTRLGTLKPGQEALVCAEVLVSDVLVRQRRSLIVRISDGSGTILLRFFHFSQSQARQFQPGRWVRCFGDIRRGPGMLEMVHPEYRLLHDDTECQESTDTALTPFYPATQGVQQITLRRLSDQALGFLDEHRLPDYLPQLHLGQTMLPDLASALRIVHRPPPGSDVAALIAGRHPAHRRLALEELVAHRLGLQRLRVAAMVYRAPLIRPSGVLQATLRQGLSFRLTPAQERVLRDIVNDMGSGEPMLRLIQGDVGSGKTIVAALAAAQVVESGHQVAMMAPTEILAEQHLLDFTAWFEPMGIEVAWLSGRLRARQRRSTLDSIALGCAKIVIGTHALLQKDVHFQDLGLAIIDEQHRFGVHQRLTLRNQGAQGDSQPHQLIMTATPIPRTLAMIAYADLQVSLIDQLPPGRKPVTTVAVDNTRRAEVIQRVGAAIDAGRQVYWVCTLIEESESLQAEAAEQAQITLQCLLPRHRLGLVHGRMKPLEKEAIMTAFKERQLDLLIATTVIEVGVDVPNASLMIIENAERLGLSQLHQLRGRVGRGQAQSSCVLLYQSPLSGNARERLDIMRETNDGFLIAEKDLFLRGAGEVLGTRQTGLAEFRIAELGRDADLLETVSELADRLLERDEIAAKGLIRRWIGDEKKDYGAV